jgi:uncharacterized membrane protein
MSAPSPARSAAEQLRHDEVWNTIALCSLLGIMGLTTAGALVGAMLQHPGASLETTLGALAVIVAAGFILLIVYIVSRPLYDTKANMARSTTSKARTPN